MKKAKSLPKLKAEAQKIFNSYIRKRDLKDDTYFKCIACGEIKLKALGHASHFYNVGHYDALRYDPENCHLGCSKCNTFLHGNLIEYRDNLVDKIGIDKFNNLQLKAGLYKRNGYKFTRTEVQEIIKKYNQKLKDLT